jgi:DNA-directed RNA polymerase subunit K/omega
MSDDEANVSCDENDESGVDTDAENDDDDDGDSGATDPNDAPDQANDDPMIDHRVLPQFMRQETDANPIYMTKYEYTRLKGERLQQLCSGAIPCVPYTTADTTDTIFLREFRDGKLPLLVERKNPNGKHIFIKIRHFSNRHSFEAL